MNLPTRLPLLLLCCAAGAAGGILARALDAREPAPRAERGNAPAADVPVAEILARLSALEDRERTHASTRGSLPGDRDGVAGDASPARRGGAAGDEKAAPAPDAPPNFPKADPLAGILGRPFGYGESEAFFERLARSRDSIDDAIARLEKEIAHDPRSADLHVALATAYGAKTAFATPPGPEQGVVWEKAERAYAEAIRLDPEHWQARYGRAFGDSMAPEFVGLRPRAIRQFEELMELQERKPAAPEHVEVYLRLGTLMKDAGNAKRAREIWRRGLDRFPEDARLAEVLALVEEK